MWELNHKEDWILRNWCFQIVALEKTLKSPLDSKEIKPVSLKGNQPWIFIGRTDVEAEAPILWLSDAKHWFIGKDPDGGKDWKQEEKGWQWMRWLKGITNSMTWVWASSRRWWRREKPSMLQSVVSQKSDTAECLNWTDNVCMYRAGSSTTTFKNILFTSHFLVQIRFWICFVHDFEQIT